MDATLDLTGRILIAMPGMEDPRFANAVVFLCAHSTDGAMGLIVNKPMQGLKLATLLEQLSIKVGDQSHNCGLHFGGPVEGGRGFVLHTAEYVSDISTLKVSPEFSMTATLDILEDMAVGNGPAKTVVALGYSGWGAGQLEAEISENGWLICDATADIVFGVKDTGKWPAALESIGVNALTLSATAGHA